MYLEKLEESFNIDQLILEVEYLLSIHSTVSNQLALNHRPGYFDQRWVDGAGSPYTTKASNNIVKNRSNNTKPRFEDTDFTILNPELEDMEIGKIYKVFSEKYTVGRYRLVSLPPKYCYGWHYDLERRIHIPVITNPGAFIITDDEKATHLPADGSSWLFTANNCYHTAMNSSYDEDRIHLLLNIWS